MTKLRKLRVHFPAWRCYVQVLLTPNVTETLQEFGAVDPDAEAVTQYALNGAGSRIILPLKPSAEVVAHEAWHAINHILEFSGAQKDNETVAYHLGYLVGKIDAFVKGDLRVKR